MHLLFVKCNEIDHLTQKFLLINDYHWDAQIEKKKKHMNQHKSFLLKYITIQGTEQQ